MKNWIGLTSSALAFTGFAAAALVALNGAFLSDGSSESASSKQTILNKHSHPYGAAAKGGGQLEVSLASDVEAPIPSATAFTLTGSITATSDLQELQFEWILPSGVTVVSGSTTGVVGDLENGASSEKKIQLMTSTNENIQVQLHVYRFVGGEPIGHMSQFNTRDQAKIVEEVKSKVQALSRARSREPASHHRKLMQ